MDKPLVIVDPGHGGLSSFFYDLDNGVKLPYSWEEVAALPEERRHYVSRSARERWKRGELTVEPRFYFEDKGRRVTWGDPGTLSPLDPRICEKDLVLDVARSLHRLLAERVAVKLTRDRDGYVADESRGHAAHRAREKHGGPAVLVSLHAEAERDSEICGFRLRHPPGRGERLAHELRAALRRHLEELGLGDGLAEVHEEPMPLLASVEMPCVRVEVGFLSNVDDARRLLERHLRRELADVLARTVSGYFGRLSMAARRGLGLAAAQPLPEMPVWSEGASEALM
jgi:N-acetylmuramoyl-L-alanine amidase